MNYIVASLLINLNPENEKEIEDVYVIDNEYEERVFWILVHIMFEKNWRSLFLDGTPGVFKMVE